jgi:hypothetical protein
MKIGKVEQGYISGIALYIINGVHFGKRRHKPARMMMRLMTANHIYEVSSVAAVTDSSNAITNLVLILVLKSAI